MASFKLKVELRPNLYYNKYKFRAKFKLVGVDRTRYISSITEYKNRLDDAIVNFEEFTKYSKRLKSIDLVKIEQYLDWRKNNKKDKVMVRIEYDTCVVYSNDVSLFAPLTQFGEKFEYFEVDDSVPTGIKYFSRDPHYNYRVYFKDKKVTSEFRKSLSELRDRYIGTTNQLYFSKSLERWIKAKGSFAYVRNNYFIEYDEESTFTILSLTIGEALDKNYKCIKKPKE